MLLAISYHDILYNSLYLLIHYTYTVPPPLPTRNHNFVLYESAFFVIFTSLLYFLDSTYKWYQTEFVFRLFISLSMMPSESIAVNGTISLFWWLSSIPLCVRMSPEAEWHLSWSKNLVTSYNIICICTTSSLSIHL